MMMITYNILLILMYTFFYSNTFCVPSRVDIHLFLFYLWFEWWILTFGEYFTRGVSYPPCFSDEWSRRWGNRWLAFHCSDRSYFFKKLDRKVGKQFLEYSKGKFFSSKMYKRMEIFFLVPRRDSQIHTYRPSSVLVVVM